MKRILAKIGRFIWSRGFLKFVLWTITLIVFFYIEEDWRGARAWAATKAKWEAQGETFDPDFYYPKPVPDDQNLAALPIFKLESDPKNGGELRPLKWSAALDVNEHGGPLPNIHGNQDEIRLSLATVYAHAFPGQCSLPNPLTQLEALYPIIPELCAASVSRPYCQFFSRLFR